jgi:LysR family nitrogen assimilation transcriptional regulator
VRSAYPKASLGIVEGFSVSLQDALTQGRVDLALLYNPRPAAGVEVTTLAEEPLCLVSAPDPSQARAKITLRDLCKLPLVIPSRPNAFRMVLEHAMARQGHRANIVVEIDAVNAILALVKDGVGHALLPASAVQGRAERARWLVRQVAADSMTVQLCMASSAVRPMTRTQRAVQDWIMGHLRKAF